jgi:hypothetical protein
MKQLKCSNCGAPVEVDETRERADCPFCGATFIPAGVPGSIRIDARGLGEGLGKLARGVVIGVVVIVVAIVALVVGVGFLASRSATRVANAVRPSPPLAQVERPLAVDRLAGLSESGRFEVDAALPPGGLAQLDGAAALPWALALAQHWAPDARPSRIDVTRMRPDGTVNALDDAAGEVLWRFRSPQRLAALRERANLEAGAQGRFELFLFARQGKILVQSIEAPAAMLRMVGEMPPYPDVPPLVESLRIANASPDFPRVPFYAGYLLHLEREGWCWYLSTLSGEPSIPRLRARDGKFWPYRS